MIHPYIVEKIIAYDKQKLGTRIGGSLVKHQAKAKTKTDETTERLDRISK